MQDAYDWDPAAYRARACRSGDVLGVEAPLWRETTADHATTSSTWRSRGSPAIAEIGWSPARGRSWGEYRVRLGAQGPLLARFGVRYYRSPEVPWR